RRERDPGQRRMTELGKAEGEENAGSGGEAVVAVVPEAKRTRAQSLPVYRYLLTGTWSRWSTRAITSRMSSGLLRYAMAPDAFSRDGCAGVASALRTATGIWRSSGFCQS